MLSLLHAIQRGTLHSRLLHRHLLYPAAVLLRGESSVFARERRLREMEQWSPDRVLEHQMEKLRSVLRYARDHCAWYRTRIPDDQAIQRDTPGVLAQLPVLDKTMLQLELSALTARPAPKHVSAKVTGGSTGQAVTVLKDADAIASEMAASWLGYSWFGVRRGDRGVRFWGEPFNRTRKLRFRAADIAMNRLRFSAFAFSEEDLERHWYELLAFGPDFLYGYTSMLVAFAEFLSARGLDGRRLPLKVVISTSEVLAEPHRALLEQTFGCPVQNEYGCGEFGPIAYSCPVGSLHVMTDNVYLEVEPTAGTDDGNLLVTDLNNRALPLVRYRVGDSSAPGAPCSCGRPFPVLRAIHGREHDIVIGLDGRRFNGLFFIYAFEELRKKGYAVGKYQILQQERDRLKVLIVYPTELDAELKRILHARLSENLPGVVLDIQRVPQIEPAASGKARLVISDVAQTLAVNPRTSATTRAAS